MNLADRVRANPNASQAYAAEGGLGAYTDNGAGAVHDCSAAQLAAEDVYCWQQMVRSLLPADTGAVAGGRRHARPHLHHHAQLERAGSREPGRFRHERADLKPGGPPRQCATVNARRGNRPD